MDKQHIITTPQKNPSIDFFKKQPDGYCSLKKLSFKDFDPTNTSGYFLIVPAHGIPFLQKATSRENTQKITIVISNDEINAIKNTPLSGVNRGAIIVTIDGKPYPIISIDDQRTPSVITTIAEPTANSKPNEPIIKKTATQQARTSIPQKPLNTVTKAYRNLLISCSISSFLLIISLIYYFHPESFNGEWFTQLFNNSHAETLVQ